MARTSSKDEQIGKRVLTSALSNYAGKVIRLGTYFILTPFILAYLGPTNFGLWALIGSVVLFGELLDFGLAGALTKYVAEYWAKGDLVRARAVIATTLRLYCGLGLIGMLLCIGFAPFFPDVFNVPAADRVSASWLMVLMGFTVGISIPTTTAWATLEGLQRYDLENLLETIWTILGAIGTVIILLLGGGLIGMVLLNVPLMIVMPLVAVACIKRIAPGLWPGWHGADRSVIRQITSFSSSLFMIQAAQRLETKTDEIVIGAFLPIAAITPYSIARKLADLPTLISQQALRIFLPLAAQLDAEADRHRLRTILMSGTRLTLATSVPLTAVLVLLAANALTAWVGAAYASSAHLLVILVIAALFSASQGPALMIMQGMNRHRPVAIMSLGSALTNLGLSVALIHRMGVTGVALGTLIPTTTVSVCLVIPYAMRELEVRPSEMLRRVYVPTLVPAVPTVVLLLLCRAAFPLNSLAALAIVTILALLVYALGYLAFGATPYERQMYRSLARAVLNALRARIRRLSSTEVPTPIGRADELHAE